MSSRYGMSFYRKEKYLSEQQRITKFAPRVFCKGPHIRGFEELCRLVYFPEHLNPDGTFRPESISREDLTDKGFSVQRIAYTNRTKIDELIDFYTSKNSTRKFHTLFVFTAWNVRKIKDPSNFQAFIIIDDALISSDRGHALILCAERHKPSIIKELRWQLACVINNPQNIDKYFP